MVGTAMFPLGAVLFPHTPVALRVFEERYLVLVGRLMDAEEPDFGVVLIERGSETGAGQERFGVGTLARLTRVLPEENQLAIVAQGTQRVEVVKWLDDDPYPRAVVRAMPDLEWHDQLAPLLAEGEHIVRRVLGRAEELGSARWNPRVELSDDPLARAWQIAAIAPLTELDRLELLRSRTAGALLRQTIDLTLAAEPFLAETAPDGLIVVEDDSDE